MARPDDGVGKPRNSVADLRAQIQAKPVKGAKAPNHNIKSPKPPPPPKASKNKQAEPKDKRDEAAERAERLAHQSHSTSLLKDKKIKTLYKEDKPKGGAVSFVIQLLGVIILCGGVAYLSDPNVMASIPWDEIKDRLKLDQFGIH